MIQAEHITFHHFVPEDVVCARFNHQPFHALKYFRLQTDIRAKGHTILNRVRPCKPTVPNNTKLNLVELFAFDACAFRDPLFGVDEALTLNSVSYRSTLPGFCAPLLTNKEYFRGGEGTTLTSFTTNRKGTP